MGACKKNLRDAGLKTNAVSGVVISFYIDA